MSENILQSDTNETKQDYAETVTSQQVHSSWNEEQQKQDEVCNKQQLLSEKTSIIFQELYNTLENEQAKLFELEERRKKLQEEMLLLKAEIEKEMQYFNVNIIQSVTENLTGINNIRNTNGKVCDESKKVGENFKSHAFTEGDEQHQCITLRNLYANNSQELNEEIDQSTQKKE